MFLCCDTQFVRLNNPLYYGKNGLKGHDIEH